MLHWYFQFLCTFTYFLFSLFFTSIYKHNSEHSTFPHAPVFHGQDFTIHKPKPVFEKAFAFPHGTENIA